MSNANAKRHPLAIAIDAWLADPETQRLLSGEASGVYLRNRLELAFASGWNACESSAVAATKTGAAK